MSIPRAAAASVLALGLGSLAPAQTRFAFDNLAYSAGAPVGPLSFSEPQFPEGTVVNGLSIIIVVGPTPLRLSFGFTLYGTISDDASIKDFTGAPFASLSDFVIEGTAAGILKIDFGAAATDVAFDFSLDAFGESVPNACTVTAFTAGGAKVGSIVVDADPLLFYPEGHVAFSSATPFQYVEIDFETALAEEIPALDHWGLAALAALVGLAGGALLRRSAQS